MVADQAATLVDVVCAGCGCLCDDVRLRASGNGHWQTVDLECELGEQWFAQPPNEARAWINGKPATLVDACDAAANQLKAAQSPLICGLSGVSIEAQRLAVQLADQLGGCIDTAVGNSDHASIESFQTRGASAASWGEVAQRADLVIFWRCDPDKTHPRHGQRYSLQPTSQWLPEGRNSRTVVTVDVGGPNKKSSKDRSIKADIEISLKDTNDIDALWTLRALIHEEDIAPAEAPESLVDLSKRMKNASYVVMLYGSELKQLGPMAIGGMTALAQELHQHTRAIAMSLGATGNGAGAENVLAWQTGYPAAVSFARGYPRFALNETTTPKLLAEQSVDAALVVDYASLQGMPKGASGELGKIPSVVLSSEPAISSSAGSVVIQTAQLGWREGESVHRSDGPALPLRHNLGGDAPSTAEVLAEIAKRLA